MYDKNIKRMLNDHEARISKLEERYTITNKEIQKPIPSEKIYSIQELEKMKMPELRTLGNNYNLKETSKETLIGKFLNKQSNEIIKEHMEME